MRFIFGFLIAVFAGSMLSAKSAEDIRVVMTTELGEIELVFAADKAPATVANFMSYVDRGFYNGGVFHRAVTMDNQSHNQIKIEVIQGGINPARRAEDGPTIALERTRDTGLLHLDGTISMARLEPYTATSDFFICVNDQPELDFNGKRNPDGQGFAAFGQVIRGMEIVRAIQNSPIEKQAVTSPVKILSIERVDK
ncbi:MAG: peptidylprolyl isomerase [Opitutaceae bacterium]|jgi:peptidyl-prolyl cis-trans isomerase A (cyclophilin A)|nr:peptidylprolyl isomerase [Opitutaceae bacterium]|tara:strand:+ start:6515 stop:7102 length:588 start_codon:yes stop_codon:yes gene_type:complete